GGGGNDGGDAVSASGFAQPAKDINKGDYKIAFIPLGASGPTIPMTLEGYQDAVGGEGSNIKIEVFDSQFDTTNQINIMNECITQGFDAIILEPNDANALNDVMAQAEAAGIPVVTRNVGATGPRTGHVLNSDYRAGWDAGAYIKENADVPEKAKVLMLDVVADLKPTTRMGTGFEDFLKQETAWELLETQAVENTSQENANTIMRDLLTKYDDIDIVYTVNDDCAMGALQAIESAGRQKEGIIIWGYEGHPNALVAIKEGRLYGTSYADVYQQSYATMMQVLYFIQTGITAKALGFEYYPTIEFKTFPCTVENYEEILRYTHWDLD
ncbi:MAG: sugar ABC transporter substrate-binding protein, partial [Clostridiales Family XIII bacterium]|nr:sugar ABC transporter substrate-binding protein [Clostridiales Family XIII bacterium]